MFFYFFSFLICPQFDESVCCILDLITKKCLPFGWRTISVQVQIALLLWFFIDADLFGLTGFHFGEEDKDTQTNTKFMIIAKVEIQLVNRIRCRTIEDHRPPFEWTESKKQNRKFFVLVFFSTNWPLERKWNTKNCNNNRNLNK